MFRMLKLLPLLMLQSSDESEPDFFGVFQKINENLEAIRDRLTPQEPENPSGEEGDQNSQGTQTETLSENQNQTTEELKTPAAVENPEPEIAVESPTEPKRKRYPWAKR